MTGLLNESRYEAQGSDLHFGIGCCGSGWHRLCTDKTTNYCAGAKAKDW
jgi:hypothetical protein